MSVGPSVRPPAFVLCQRVSKFNVVSTKQKFSELQWMQCNAMWCCWQQRNIVNMNDVDVVDKVDDMGDCHVVFYFDDVYEVDGVDKISNIND